MVRAVRVLLGLPGNNRTSGNELLNFELLFAGQVLPLSEVNHVEM